jgi:hypothetical protein
MKRFLGAMLAIMLSSSLARADGEDPKAILDKAIQALGGEDKLKGAEAFSWKSKGTMNFNGNDNKFSVEATVQGLDHYRSVFESQFDGRDFKAVAVVNGNKGWRRFGDMLNEMDEDAVANEKRSIYLQIIPVRILPLKATGFKVESAGEEKVGDKQAFVIKATPPDGKEFQLYIDKQTSLPVKLVAKVIGFGGEEFTMETTYADYKDFNGIKKATKVESKRDGEPFVKSELAEFKVIDKVDPKTFDQPE